jgi:enoyl-CoA hydratase/carnithine racemase
MSGHLSVTHDSGVTTVALRPEDLEPAGVGALHGALQAAATDEAVRVVILCSAEGEVRSAASGGACRDLSRLLRNLPQPVVAKVRGAWHGDVLALLSACDIVYASDDAQFTLHGAAGEAFLDGPLGQAMASVMTPRSLSRHALDGRPFDGVEAELNGLTTLSFPPDELDPETDALVAGLLEKDPLALQFTKQTLRHVPSMSWDAVLDYNAAKFAQLKALQAGKPSARATAVESFLAGTSKPGLGR